MDTRKRVIEKRKSLPIGKRHEYNRRILASVMSLPIWRTAKIICSYVSLPEEVDTSLLVRELLMDRRTVVVPRVSADKSLRLYRIHTFDDLSPGHLSVFEPKDYCPEVSSVDVDLFIVPGVVFDKSGNRLGFGRGYYDRLLAGLEAPKVALAYSFQVVAAVRHTSYDVQMTYIVTDKEIIEGGI